MRILYIFLLLIFLRLLSYFCFAKSRLVNTKPSDPKQILTKIDLEYLCHYWVYLREEQKQMGEGEIYRLKRFKQFPTSRFRMQYKGRFAA